MRCKVLDVTLRCKPRSSCEIKLQQKDKKIGYHREPVIPVVFDSIIRTDARE